MNAAKEKVEAQDKARTKKLRENQQIKAKRELSRLGTAQALKDNMIEQNTDRVSTHQMHFQRRQKMQQIHKEILIHDLIEKQQLQERLAKMKHDCVKMAECKNSQIMDMVTDVSKKHDFTMRAVNYEQHVEEWKIDIKR